MWQYPTYAQHALLASAAPAYPASPLTCHMPCPSDRTSSGHFLKRGQDEVVKLLEERIADWTRLPMENGEPFHVGLLAAFTLLGVLGCRPTKQQCHSTAEHSMPHSPAAARGEGRRAERGAAGSVPYALSC